MKTPKNSVPIKKAKPQRAVLTNSGSPASGASISKVHKEHKVQTERLEIPTAPKAFKLSQERLKEFEPLPLSLSFQDWLLAILENPKNLSLVRTQIDKTVQDLPKFINQVKQAAIDVPLGPISVDHRYQDELWSAWPFSIYSQNFLHLKQWWTKAFSSLPGESKNQMTMIHFATLQLIESISPSNFLPTNPVLIQKTIKEAGMNLIRGQSNFWEDCYRSLFKLSPKGFEKFVVGQNMAITPGKVVFKDDLMELIQYTPSTQKVKAEPVLIVPAWIMKYYILDLSPDNSLIKYLVDQGHTVFAISWKNPNSEDRYIGLEDYLNLGVLGALEQIGSICTDQRVHAVGYCLGGTLLSIAAAKMGRDKDHTLASVTLLAAQTDFSEPGNIGMFIDQAKIGLIESVMRPNGYLDSSQMSSAFQMIGSADRKWAQLTKEYIAGDRSEPNDLMAWNADGTRLSIRMHSQYLRHMYLRNDLARGRYRVGNKTIHLEDIACPVFAVGTVQDFVAPWRSVYKIHDHIKSPLEFVLTSGGHNAGIVSPPGLANRSYKYLAKVPGGESFTPDEWVDKAAHAQGSWWEHWNKWINSHSTNSVVPPGFPDVSSNLGQCANAPGSYVFE